MSFAVVAVSITFWACVALVGYAYVGYPLLLWVLSRTAGRRRVPPAEPMEELPFVSVIIAAHNEESVIGPRLDNRRRSSRAPSARPSRISSLKASIPLRMGTDALAEPWRKKLSPRI